MKSVSAPEHVDPALRAWQVDLAEFPIGASTTDVFRFAVRYAVLAPSSHNSQPWLFAIEGTHLDLYLDLSRALPVTDPDDREQTISCGAALLNLRLTLVRLGYRTRVDVLPAPKDPALLARVRLDGSATPDANQTRLFDQIARRGTSRAAFSADPLPAAFLHALDAHASSEGAWLHLAVDERPKALLADLVADADRRQMSDRRFRRELAAWIRSNHGHELDGIRGHGLGMTDVMSLAAPLILRTFDQGDGAAARDRAIATGSPVLAVLGTEHDDPADWLRTGQALQRLLLHARANDIRVGFLNQPIEVDALRPEVAITVGRIGYPQLLLRFGRGPEPLPEPRREIADVIIRSSG